MLNFFTQGITACFPLQIINVTQGLKLDFLDIEGNYPV